MGTVACCKKPNELIEFAKYYTSQNDIDLKFNENISTYLNNLATIDNNQTLINYKDVINNLAKPVVIPGQIVINNETVSTNELISMLQDKNKLYEIVNNDNQKALNQFNELFEKFIRNYLNRYYVDICKKKNKNQKKDTKNFIC